MANRRKNVDEFLDGKNHRLHNRTRRRRNAQNHAQRNGQNGFRSVSCEVDLHELGLPDAKATVKRVLLEKRERRKKLREHLERTETPKERVPR